MTHSSTTYPSIDFYSSTCIVIEGLEVDKVSIKLGYMTVIDSNAIFLVPTEINQVTLMLLKRG